MKNLYFFRNKKLLVQQTVFAWVILNISLVLYMLVALLLSRYENNQQSIIIFSFLITAPVVLLAHVYAYRKKYYIPINLLNSEQRHKVRQSSFINNNYLVIAGIGIGWLAGLSASPVVSIVITSITGSMAAVIAALTGLEDRSADEIKKQTSSYRWKINPQPLAILVLGLMLGSIVGIRARYQNWLGSDISSEIAKWTSAGLSEEEVARALFESQYAIANASTTSAQGTVLFGEDTTECTTLRAAALMPSSDILINELKSSTVEQWRNLPDIVADPQTLKEIIERVICADQTK